MALCSRCGWVQLLWWWSLATRPWGRPWSTRGMSSAAGPPTPSSWGSPKDSVGGKSPRLHCCHEPSYSGSMTWLCHTFACLSHVTFYSFDRHFYPKRHPTLIPGISVCLSVCLSVDCYLENQALCEVERQQIFLLRTQGLAFEGVLSLWSRVHKENLLPNRAKYIWGHSVTYITLTGSSRWQVQGSCNGRIQVALCRSEQSRDAVSIQFI